LGCVIYGLLDPRNGYLRYVGKTATTLHKRRLSHLSDVRRGRVYIPRHKWISELLAAGLEPEGVEIESDPADWREAEQHWIGFFRAAGCDLLNATDGGDGLESFRHTPETRAKQSAAARRRYQDDGERERTGQAVRAGHSRPGAASGKGRTVSAETRSKLSEIMATARWAPEARAAQSARLRGVPKTEEHRAKASAAMKGRKRTPESIEKQVAKMTGRKLSDETRAKIRAAHLARHQGEAA